MAHLVMPESYPSPRPTSVSSDDTVCLRRQADGWSVWLGDDRLLVVDDEEAAFQYACDVHRREGGENRRLLILSGPSWA